MLKLKETIENVLSYNTVYYNTRLKALEIAKHQGYNIELSDLDNIRNKWYDIDSIKFPNINTAEKYKRRFEKIMYEYLHIDVDISLSKWSDNYYRTVSFLKENTQEPVFIKIKVAGYPCITKQEVSVMNEYRKIDGKTLISI